ncbi:MAG: hypothetical protein VZQ47_02410 [Treponema sp.]|nr:hypothetical protein [Treponema sp.]
MSNLEFFKRQAKNLLKDWNSRKRIERKDGTYYYRYGKTFFDVKDLFKFFYMSIKDEESFCLQKSQHIIAQMVGFRNWDELKSASDDFLELSELLLRHFKNSNDIIGWQVFFEDEVNTTDVQEIIKIAKNYFEIIAKSKIQTESVVLTGEERIQGLKRNLQVLGNFRMNSKVICIHCGAEFHYNEAIVIRDPGDYKALVMCKNYPKCNGSLIDLHNLDKKHNGDDYRGVPFDLDMDNGYVSEYDS